MSAITFRGAVLRYADLRRREEAGVFARIHVTAEVTKPVMEAMDWQEIPTCVDSGKLDGILTARHLIWTPNQKELRSHEIQMEATEVGDFQFFRVRGDDGQSTHAELRFIVRVSEPGAIAQLEDYMRTVGEARGALKITYTDQSKLPLDEQTEGEDDEPKTMAAGAEGSATEALTRPGRAKADREQQARAQKVGGLIDRVHGA